MQRHLDHQRNEQRRDLIYPWPELDDAQQEITFVGFGSLINEASAQRTLRSSFPNRVRPCLVFGAKRLYNRVMSKRGYRHYAAARPQTPMAVLNVTATGLASDYFNGVLLTLKRADLEAFRTREQGYDLIPVTSVPFDSPHDTPRQVYCLASRKRYFDGRCVLSNKLTPQPGYHALCEEGCAAISPQFLDVFRYTTWVSQASDVAKAAASALESIEPAWALPPS